MNGMGRIKAAEISWRQPHSTFLFTWREWVCARARKRYRFLISTSSICKLSKRKRETSTEFIIDFNRSVQSTFHQLETSSNNQLALSFSKETDSGRMLRRLFTTQSGYKDDVRFYLFRDGQFDSRAGVSVIEWPTVDPLRIPFHYLVA